MLHRLLLTLFIGFAPLVKAESAMPDCPADPSAVFDNCFGTYGLMDRGTWVSGKTISGMGKELSLSLIDRHGLGIGRTVNSYPTFVSTWV